VLCDFDGAANLVLSTRFGIVHGRSKAFPKDCDEYVALVNSQAGNGPRLVTDVWACRQRVDFRRLQQTGLTWARRLWADKAR